MSIDKEKLAYLSAERGLMTTREVAAYMHMSASGVDKIRREHGLPFVKIGKSVRFERKDIDRYIDSNKRTNNPDEEVSYPGEY